MEDNGSSDEDEMQEESEGGAATGDGGNDETDEEEQQFDISLAASHSYMGPGLESVSSEGVRPVEAGWEGSVPVMAHHGTVFPGETVPLLFAYEPNMDIITHTVYRDRLFGLLCPDESGSMVSGYGVLCQVYERPALPDDEAELERQRGLSPPRMSFKARATHRFRCKQMPKHAVPLHAYDTLRMVEIRVLAEVRLRDPLRHVRLASLDPLRAPHTQLARRVRSMDATLTPWPLFVYDIFDFGRMRAVIHDYFKSMALKNVPEEPVSLSFWTASNLALSPRDRLALFVVDDALLRLHMEVRFIAKKSVLCCASCAADIARREHIFAMSSEGVHANYTNLGGFMHDIITVSRVRHTRDSGRPSAEFSWFPGYTWTIIVCVSCMAHVGWRFDAQRRNLRPQTFYGLCRNYVTPRRDDERPPATHPPRLPEYEHLYDALPAAERSLAELRAAYSTLQRRQNPPRFD